MDKVRQGLVHGLVLLRRSSDADTAGGGVVLVQILKVYTATDAALQQDGGQVGDHINGEVEVHLHAVRMGELQILHGLAEVPVLLVQTNLGENLAEGDLLLFLILQKCHKVQAVVRASDKVAPVFFDIHASCLLFRDQPLDEPVQML